MHPWPNHGYFGLLQMLGLEKTIRLENKITNNDSRIIQIVPVLYMEYGAKSSSIGFVGEIHYNSNIRLFGDVQSQRNPITAKNISKESLSFIKIKSNLIVNTSKRRKSVVLVHSADS